mmetsp:Transcript_9936/g.22442  ORF Transcript_9936/g.22442 Transcript_9936/m.22442 type:complete len:237 (+) Transcript_9936:390-1100(+)
MIVAVKVAINRPGEGPTAAPGGMFSSEVDPTRDCWGRLVRHRQGLLNLHGDLTKSENAFARQADLDGAPGRFARELRRVALGKPQVARAPRAAHIYLEAVQAVAAAVRAVRHLHDLDVVDLAETNHPPRPVLIIGVRAAIPLPVALVDAVDRSDGFRAAALEHRLALEAEPARGSRSQRDLRGWLGPDLDQANVVAEVLLQAADAGGVPPVVILAQHTVAVVIGELHPLAAIAQLE